MEIALNTQNSDIAHFWIGTEYQPCRLLNEWLYIIMNGLVRFYKNYAE